MSLVRTTCDRCGTIEMHVNEVKLRICEDDSSGSVIVSCPGCGSRFVKDADEAMMLLLMVVGIEVVLWKRPSERIIEGTTSLDAIHVEQFRDLLSDEEAVFGQLERLGSIETDKS